MTDFQGLQSIRITCAPGLVDFLVQEVEAHGFAIETSRLTGVEIKATLDDAIRLNLYLRTALNVLVLIDAFKCENPDQLYERARRLHWEQIIAPDGYLTVVSSVNTPTITDSRFANRRLKDAIVDRISDMKGSRPDSGPDRHKIVVQLFWHGDDAQLFFNTSGQKLADRGYRRIPHKAPMQETLAAGVMLATGYDGSTPLVNPMCGSGTLAIEAALIASHRPPGLLRANYGFMHAIGFDAEAWQAHRRAAKKIRNKGKIAPIIATDIDPVAIQVAQKNAETAGVHHMIQFDVCDFEQSPLPDDKGIIVINPEYGERMGELSELKDTYARMGDFFKQKCSGWTGYIFTGNLDLAKRVGLRASRRIEFYNAKIECRLLKYEMYLGTRKKKKLGDQSPSNLGE